VASTPLLCKAFLKTKPAGGEAKDPYDGALFRLYKSFLVVSIRHRWITIAVVVAMFAAAMFGFGFVKQSFFPDSTRPQFMVDLWFPEGQRIEETEARVAEAEAYLLELDEVLHVSSSIGGGHTRFLLTYTGEKPWEAYAQILVDVNDWRMVSELMERVESELPGRFPEALIAAQKFIMGPGEAGKIRVRVSGPDTEVLRELAGRAQRILEDHPNTKLVRNDWRDKIKVLRPKMAEAQARAAGIERPQLSSALESAIDGKTVGVYRERDELLRIVARSPESERVDFSNLGAIRVWSPAAQAMIPMAQVVSGFETVFEDPYIWRRHRTRTITVFADPRTGLASEVFQDVKVPIEQALGLDVEGITGATTHEFGTIKVVDDGKLPLEDLESYTMAWGGQAEDSARAGASLASS
jgi:multidrug efflux pump subunit AcrB